MDLEPLPAGVTRQFIKYAGGWEPSAQQSAVRPPPRASRLSSAPPPSGPAPPPSGPAPPLLGALASSFRVALGWARRGHAGAREFGARPRARAFPRRLAAGEALGARSPGPCRVRPFLYFSLLRVSVFFLRRWRWGWAWPGRSAAPRPGSLGARRRSRSPPLPRRPRRARGAWWGPWKQLPALGRFSGTGLPAGREVAWACQRAGLFTPRFLRALVPPQPLVALQPRVGPLHACACCSCVCFLHLPLGPMTAAGAGPCLY